VSTCPIHPGRQAEDGYTLCGRVGIDPDGRNYWTGCLGTLRANLGDLAETLPSLGDLLVTPMPTDGNDRRAAKSEGQPPCRLDVLDLMDPRSDTPALALLATWCAAVMEERQLSTMPTDPAQQARWLARHHLDWLARHPAADEIAGDIGNAWRWVRAAAGMAPLPPVFACPVLYPDSGQERECGGAVYPLRWAFGVRCAKCGAEWDGDQELRRLGLVRGAMA
jgi:hypothetical protein